MIERARRQQPQNGRVDAGLAVLVVTPGVDQVAMLLVPVAGMQQMIQQMTEAVQHIQKQEAARAEQANAKSEAAKDESTAEEALTNL